MKKFTKSILGVTLLEIMLVLAVAAMVIVMSIRYYQSATTSQQANMAMSQIQAITSAADNLAIGTGSYTAVTQAAITKLLGTLTSPTGAAVTVSDGAATSYTVTMPLTEGSCASVLAKLAAVPKIDSPSCDSSNNLIYTYNSTK